jgi:2-dehydropantoate 2-reductase
MKIAVMGAGGIGCYLGGKLAQSGHEVTLICRGAHLEAIRANGLTMRGAGGDAVVRGIKATADPATVGVADVILQCVKLYDLAATSRQMQAMVGPDTLVVPVQNGVTGHEEIGAVIGSQHVVGGLVFLSSFVIAPGVVERKSAVDALIFGEIDGTLSARVRAFRDAGTAAGYEAIASENILAESWSKFVMLAGTSAVSCLARQPVGRVCEDTGLSNLMEQGIREAVAVAAAKGIVLASDVVEKSVAFNRSVKYGTRISMLEDLEAGKPLELDWTSGYLVREARRLGVPVPLHEMAYACLKPVAGGTHRR